MRTPQSLSRYFIDWMNVTFNSTKKNAVTLPLIGKKPHDGCVGVGHLFIIYGIVNIFAIITHHTFVMCE